jgi:energy-converting hydrogenase Eha subunit C
MKVEKLGRHVGGVNSLQSFMARPAAASFISLLRAFNPAAHPTMGVADLLASVGRRFVLFFAIFLWSPLAYAPGKDGAKPEPMAVLPAVARSIVEPNLDSETVTQASVAEHFLIVGLMPGILIRTPIKVWTKLDNTTELWEKLKEEAIPLSLSKTSWYDKLEQRNILVGASWACAIGAFTLIFARKPHAAAFACALLNVGLVLFSVVACYFNSGKLTPQAVVALLASVFESRAAAAWSARAREALAEANRVGAAKPGPPAAAAGKKKSKKTD